MPGRLEVSREAALRALYRLGWGSASRLPRVLVRIVIRAAAWWAARRGGHHVDLLRRNLSVLTGGPCPQPLLVAALASYLRNFYEVLALPGWSEDELVGRVEVVNEAVARVAFAGPGVVVALPHSGNWDLAGAWACTTGMPVTTVAERLKDAEYAAFVAFREALGMQVLPHRDPGVIGQLVDAVRRGRMVCLLADRDLAGAGVPVSWAGRSITMPAGPAMVARRAGASLLAAVCQFTPSGMRIVFSDPIVSRPGRNGLVAMTQEVCDFFAARIAEQPQDWHMLQPFFPDPHPGADAR